MTDAKSHAAERRRLGEFVRLRRERLSAQSAGLAAGGRRRTPGLRREEVAVLAAVSPTWITWIEQGRAVSASAPVLARLADALRLSPAERAYLFDLAGRRDPASPTTQATAADTLLGSVHVMQCPAYVLDRQWNIASANARAAELFLHWGARREARTPVKNQARRSERKPQDAPAAEPNLLKFLFLHAPARRLVGDWEGRARRLVAEFRADCGRLADEEPLRGLIEELAAESPDFARFWAGQEVLGREGGERRFHHPRLGEVAYEQMTLRPATGGDLKLVLLMAATAPRRGKRK